jgi:RNA recognition motif-containing protein
LGSKIYVGNLSFQTSKEDLQEVFEKHGTVESVAIITDRETGRPRGFAFVEMSSASEAQAAIRALDGTSMDGRPLKVNEAQEKSRGDGPRGGRPGGGGGGGGGRGRSW